jgi:outer membrane receptor for ferrienterochelin and colicins
MKHFYNLIHPVSIKKYSFILLLSFLFFISNNNFSQTDSLDIYDLNLSQLSKLKITSATKAPQNLGEIPSTILIITSSEIKEKGYFTLEEALSDLPGFQFRNIMGINSYVFQRGITNQNNLILVLIDGILVNELNSGGFYAGGQYNLSNVERIEVIYGPSSVAYGTNAVSGIINIITKIPTEKKASINMSIGTFKTAENNFTYQNFNEKKNLGIAVSGMFKTTEKADLKGLAGDNNWTDLMDNFENDYSFDVKIKAKNFVLGTNYLQKQSSYATSFKSVGTIYRDYGSLWNIRFINNYLKYNKKISDQLTFSATLYNRNAIVLANSVIVTDTAQVGSYRPGNLTGLENVLSYNSKKFFAVSGGISLEYEQLAQKIIETVSSSPDISPPDPVKPSMDHNFLASVFMEPRLTLFNSLYLSGGIRFDQSSVYDQVLTPRVGLSYVLSKYIVRLSYAEAFRAPKPWDYTDGLGNNSLLPEKMKSLEAAITMVVAGNVKMDFIGYKNTLENAISKYLAEGGYYWANVGEVNTEGFEIFFRYSSKKIKTSLNYTFTNSYNINESLIPEISKHTGNASVTYSLGNNIKLNLRANYIGKRRNTKIITSTNSYYVDPCVVFHGALSLLNYKGFTVQLIAKNILNKEYYHTSNKIPDRYRQPQRTILLSVGYSLKE